MSKVNILTVHLNNDEVGTLTQLPDDRIHFHFAKEYLANEARPVLSQSFYTVEGWLRTDIAPTQTTAPAFFANLLPEGHLREYLANNAKIKSVRDFALLQLLGHDLPGAAVIKSQENLLSSSDLEEKIIWENLLLKSLLRD
jgi:serine/threonine-protein kinase HipA